MAVISPVVVAAGLAGASLAGAGPALAAPAATPSPSPCPTQGLLGGVTGALCQTVKSLPSPGSVLPSPVASVVGSVGSAVGSAVGGVTGALTGSGSSGAGAAGATGSAGAAGAGQAGSGSAASRGHARAGGSQHTQGTVPAPGATAGSPDLGVLSSLGVPGWLVRGGLGTLPSGTVPLSFPVVHPDARAAAQAAVKPMPRAVSSLWLIFAIGAACLVGVAGGLGRFEGRRGARGKPN